MLSDHLLKAANFDLRPKVLALFEDANKLLGKVKMEISAQKEEFVRQSLATKAILSPKLMIQDHNTINKIGNLHNKLYRDVLQDRLSWDKKAVRQEKSELLTSLHCPIIRHKWKTWRTESK